MSKINGKWGYLMLVKYRLLRGFLYSFTIARGNGGSISKLTLLFLLFYLLYLLFYLSASTNRELFSHYSHTQKKTHN